MATQFRERKVKATYIMSSRAFGLGFLTAKQGQPWPREYERMTPREQAMFEYGRMLGTVAPSVQLKRGRTVTYEALAAMRDIMRAA